MIPRGKPVADIDDWAFVDYRGYDGDRDAVVVLYGVCTRHDARPDLVGKRIRTSTIVKADEAGGNVETLNTIYRLGTKSEDRPAYGKADDLPPQS